MESFSFFFSSPNSDLPLLISGILEKEKGTPAKLSVENALKLNLNRANCALSQGAQLDVRIRISPSCA